MLRKIMVLLAVASTLPALDIEEGQRYLLLATTKTSTMQKELSEAAAAGFRILRSTFGGEIVVLMERKGDGVKFEYKVVATTKTSTAQKELNEAGAEGFELIPTAVFGMTGRSPLLGGNEVIAILERPADSGKRTVHHYRLLATVRTSTLQKEVSAAQGDGFVLVGLLSRGENMVVMHKAGAPVK